MGFRTAWNREAAMVIDVSDELDLHSHERTRLVLERMNLEVRVAFVIHWFDIARDFRS
jgi:hypothetical protein